MRRRDRRCTQHWSLLILVLVLMLVQVQGQLLVLGWHHSKPTVHRWWLDSKLPAVLLAHMQGRGRTAHLSSPQPS